MLFDQLEDSMRAVGFKARFISSFLALTLACPAWAKNPDCESELARNPRPLIEKIFNEKYNGQIGMAGKAAYAVLSQRLTSAIMKECGQRACTDEDVAQVTEKTLERLFHVTDRVDKFSHKMHGWIVLAATFTGLFAASYFVGPMLPPEIRPAIPSLVGFTAGMLLRPVLSTPSASAFRGIYRAIAFGMPFVRNDEIAERLDDQSRIVRAKQTSLETAEVSRIMQIASYAAPRAKEAGDMINTDQKIGPGRAASNLATVAIYVHEYFPELDPAGDHDVTMAVRQLFTQWLPTGWSSEKGRTELAKMIFSQIQTYDPHLRNSKDENYYRLLVTKWMNVSPTSFE